MGLQVVFYAGQLGLFLLCLKVFGVFDGEQSYAASAVFVFFSIAVSILPSCMCVVIHKQFNNAVRRIFRGETRN